MNYPANTTQWKRGDFVVHDCDAKKADLLMVVAGYDKDGLCRTFYFNPEHQKKWGHPARSRLLNRVCVLHDPLQFKIALPGIHTTVNEVQTKHIPETPGWSRCCTCHYQWRTGQDGSHSCSEHLGNSLRRARAKLTMIQRIQFEGMPEPWRTRVCDVLANGADRGAPPWPLGQEAYDRSLIQGALDSMGVALASHRHRWTDGERAIYEQATELLSSKLLG